MQPLDFRFDPDFSTCENGEHARREGFTPPAMSATNPGASLLERVHATWGRACAAVELQSHRYQHRWQGAIVDLNDDRGTLQVTWRDAQSRVMFEGVIMGAWERECEHAGAHRLASEELARA